MNRCTFSKLGVFCLAAILGVGATRAADEEPAKPAAEPYRTDANDDAKLKWFQLVEGEFPPADAAHSISGELIQLDHPNRKFVLRIDRTDKQNRGKFDLPLGAAMLPYGTIRYHGAPAALEDIPLGTHLHGQFFVKPADDATPPLDYNGRVSDEADFTRCLQLEDDFSYYARQNRLWRIEQVNLSDKKLIAVLCENNEPVGTPQTFNLLESTRVWKERGFESLEWLAPGQTVLFNVTWATLYGPGNIREIWIDDTARNFATAHQLDQHRIYVRRRGLPGRVDAVDDHAKTLTVTFFAGIDPALIKELAKGEDSGVAVAESTLMMYDPVNDRKRGSVSEINKVEPVPGSSGVQVKLQMSELLEGFRPKRIVRIYPGTWPVIALPNEEVFGLMR